MNEPKSEQCLVCGWDLYDGGKHFEAGENEYGLVGPSIPQSVCEVCYSSPGAQEGKIRVLGEDLSNAANLVLKAIRDSQWRPMRTAPRDGTVIECLCNTGESDFRPGKSAVKCPSYKGWKPCRPEWQEETD